MLNHSALYKWKQESNKRQDINKNEEWEDGSTTEKAAQQREGCRNEKDAAHRKQIYAKHRLEYN